MEQALVDRIIVVHGRGRIVFIGLIQRHKEYIQLLLRQPLHAFAHGGRLHEVHRHQQLIAGIGTMQIQRTIKAQLHRLVDKVDLLKSVLEQTDQLTQQCGAVG